MTFAHAIGRSLISAMLLMIPAAPGLRAQTADGSQTAPPPANVTLTGRVLRSSAFQTNSTGVSTNCGTASCQAVKLMFPAASLICPGPVNQTCTFYVILESSNQVSSFDQGLYRFLVDSTIPNPGPTNASGFYKFVESDANSDATRSASFAIVAKVKNTAANQAHRVTVYFGCSDASGDGCFSLAVFSSLRIDTFTP